METNIDLPQTVVSFFHGEVHLWVIILVVVVVIIVLIRKKIKSGHE